LADIHDLIGALDRVADRHQHLLDQVLEHLARSTRASSSAPNSETTEHVFTLDAFEGSARLVRLHVAALHRFANAAGKFPCLQC